MQSKGPDSDYIKTTAKIGQLTRTLAGKNLMVGKPCTPKRVPRLRCLSASTCRTGQTIHYALSA